MKSALIIFLIPVFLYFGSCRKHDGIRHNRHKNKPSVVLNKENGSVEARGEKNYKKALRKRFKKKRKTGTYGLE